MSVKEINNITVSAHRERLGNYGAKSMKLRDKYWSCPVAYHKNSFVLNQSRIVGWHSIVAIDVPPIDCTLSVQRPWLVLRELQPLLGHHSCKPNEVLYCRHRLESLPVLMNQIRWKWIKQQSEKNRISIFIWHVSCDCVLTSTREDSPFLK